MKKLKITIIIMIAAVAAAACSGNKWGKYGKGVPVSYDTLLDEAFSRAGGNAVNLRQALDETPVYAKEGMAYLIAYMPQGDLDTMGSDILIDNVRYAYEARERFAWTKNLPDSIFLNEVLPYACVDEIRENWRGKFYNIFCEKAAGCSDIREAVSAVNTDINKVVGVEYNVLREKTNQNPSESMRQHMASCTGLSILLVDAFRAAGIPARFAGTAAWHDDRGNHSWVEVWIDGKWYFTEFYPDVLDNSWFLADAGQATPEDRTHAVYAVSYKPTGDYFPMVWSPGETGVHGINVSQRYIDLYNAREDLRSKLGDYVPVTFQMYVKGGDAELSDDRVEINVDIFCNGGQVGGGRTSGPTRDMNDVLTFMLEKNNTYEFRYADNGGNPVSVTVEVKDVPQNITCFME